MNVHAVDKPLNYISNDYTTYYPLIPPGPPRSCLIYSNPGKVVHCWAGAEASPSTGRGRWSSQNLGTLGQNWSQVGAVPDNWCQLGKLLNFGLQLHPFLAHRPRGRLQRGRYCAAAQKRRVGIVFNCMLRNYWPLPRDDLTCLMGGGLQKKAAGGS